jgi:hypothetical protein
MAGEKKEPITRSGQHTDNRAHERGQSTFRSVLPEDIDWESFAGFPPSVRLAVVAGEPSASGPYVIRVKTPSGVKMMPHRHPEDRVYTVISGIFYIGLGDQFDSDKLQAYPPGSVIVLPGNISAESARGISPRAAHRSVREPLDSYGSCHSLKAVAFRYN